jgi:hypothetical protein
MNIDLLLHKNTRTYLPRDRIINLSQLIQIKQETIINYVKEILNDFLLYDYHLEEYYIEEKECKLLHKVIRAFFIQIRTLIWMKSDF